MTRASPRRGVNSAHIQVVKCSFVNKGVGEHLLPVPVSPPVSEPKSTPMIDRISFVYRVFSTVVAAVIVAAAILPILELGARVIL